MWIHLWKTQSPPTWMYFLLMPPGKNWDRSPWKGDENSIYWGPTKRQVVLWKCYPVTSFHLCMKGNFMPVFQVRGLRCSDITCPAWGYTAGKWQSWPVEGKEWAAHGFGTGLTCASASISQPSSKEGTALLPSGRWENWVSEQNASSEVSDSILMQACQGQLDFTAGWPQWKQTMDLGPRGLAQCPEFLHYTLLGVTAGWLRWKCTSYLEGITQKANISLEQSQATLCPNSTLNLFRFLSSNLNMFV